MSRTGRIKLSPGQMYTLWKEEDQHHGEQDPQHQAYGNHAHPFHRLLSFLSDMPTCGLLRDKRSYVCCSRPRSHGTP